MAGIASHFSGSEVLPPVAALALWHIGLDAGEARRKIRHLRDPCTGAIYIMELVLCRPRCTVVSLQSDFGCHNKFTLLSQDYGFGNILYLL